jgi:orotate phosphoribosyltransferase
MIADSENGPAMSLSAADKLADRTKAFELIKKLSYREGDFVLASGKKSKFYLDMKPTMFHPDGAHALAGLILDRLSSLKVDCVGGLAVGAIPLAVAVSVRSAGSSRPLPGFFVRKDVKDHGTKKRVEAAGDISNKSVVILEDVTTTGDSAMHAVEAAKSAGANVVLVLSMVDRNEGATEFFQQQGIPFDWLFRVSDFQH